MASKKQDSFKPQPLSMLTLIAQLIDEQRSNAEFLMSTLSRPPGVGALDANAVTRLKRLWGEQLEMVPIHRQQFEYWRTHCKPSTAEDREIDRLETVISEHQKNCESIVRSFQ